MSEILVNKVPTTLALARAAVETALCSNVDMPGPQHLTATAVTDWYENGKRLVNISSVREDLGWSTPRLQVVLAITADSEGAYFLWIEGHDNAYREEMEALRGAMCKCLTEDSVDTIPIPKDIRERQELVAKLYEEGLPDQKIAEAVWTSVPTVRRDRKKLGLRRR